MYRVISFAVVLFISFHTEAADLASIPDVKPQDSWTFTDTTEDKTGWHQARFDVTVVRSSSNSIVLLGRPTGSTLPGKEVMLGADWSRFRSVNGTERIVAQPLKFPLATGKSWDVEYTEENPNRQHKSEHIKSTYKVVGWDEVTVPAGAFNAIKIECDGRWEAELAPGITSGAVTHVDEAGSSIVTQSNKTLQQKATGRLYMVYWYVPSVKRIVKSIEETYDAGGVRSQRITEELEAFHPAT